MAAGAHRSGGCRLHPSEAADYRQQRADPPRGAECWHRLRPGSCPSRPVARHIAAPWRVEEAISMRMEDVCGLAHRPSQCRLRRQQPYPRPIYPLPRPVCVQNSFPAKWPSNAFLANLFRIYKYSWSRSASKSLQLSCRKHQAHLLDIPLLLFFASCSSS